MSPLRRLRVGDQLPELVRRIELFDMVAYGAATWDWHRIHYDPAHAGRAGLNGPVVDGQMFGALLAEQITHFIGTDGRITRLHYRNQAPVEPGSEVRCEASVVAVDDNGIVLALSISVGETVVVAPAGAEIAFS